MKKVIITILLISVFANAEEYRFGRSRIIGTGYRQEKGSEKIPSSLYPPALWCGYNYNDGANVYDLSGNNNTGVVTAATWVDDSKGGGYYSFTNNTITHAHNPIMTSAIPFTVCAWVKRNSQSATHWVVSRGDINSTTRDWQLYFLNSATLAANVFDSDAGDTDYIGRTGPLTATGTWVFVTLVYTGGNTSASCKLYANGRQIDNTDSKANTFGTRQRGAGSTYVGRLQNNGNPMNGLIDQVVVWPKILIVTEITNLYINSKWNK